MSHLVVQCTIIRNCWTIVNSEDLETITKESLVRSSVLEEFRTKNPQSEKSFARAKQVLPGGQTRSVTHYEPFPIILNHGSGGLVVDVDGHEYIDVLNNYTSLVHGHTFAPVVSAVEALLKNGGVAFPSVHEHQIRLAEILSDRIVTAERVRFTNSGSEAAALAARIARHVTGRREIVMAQHGYHGSVPPFSDELQPYVVRVPYNDLAAIQEVVSERTAAVILEPFQGAAGVIPGDAQYLQATQNAAAKVGALFILDEVQSLRNNYHGVQDELGLSPDLTLLGKIIGGGYPIGAVVGQAAHLEQTSPYITGNLGHSGTFNGHLASVVAGAATLEHLQSDVIKSLNNRSEELQKAIEMAAGEHGLQIQVNRAGSIMNLHPLGNVDNESFYSTLHLSLLLEGIYTAPRGLLNLSTVLDEGILRQVAEGYRKAFDRTAAALR